MERNRMYLMTEDDRSNSATALFAPRKEGQVARKIIRQPGSLEILENDERKIEKERPPSESSSRSWSGASVGSVPPRAESSLSRRTITPTKQISLQAVRRKEESSDPFIDNIDIDLDSFAFDSTRQRQKKWTNDDDFRPLSENSFVGDEYIDSGGADDIINSSKIVEAASCAEEKFTEKKSKAEIATKSKNEPTEKVTSVPKQGENKKEESSSEDEDDEDEEEEVKLQAPNELLMEFVDCLMKKDFPNAEKLCKMILLYEPENPEALKFQPLIGEKMKLDAEAAAAEEEGDSDDEDDDDSDDSDEEDDDTTSSDDDSSDDDAEENYHDKNVPSTSSKDPLPVT